MAGVTRVIDPNTRDYVADTARGTNQTTRNASTPLYHQFKTMLGQWWGDPTAGSRFHELRRAKSLLRTPVIIQDMANEAARPLVDAGQITELDFDSERITDRINTSMTATDIQSGEELELTDLLPFEP